MGLLGFLKDYVLGFWDYETPKVMVVKNRSLGLIYRGVQFLVLTYFICLSSPATVCHRLSRHAVLLSNLCVPAGRRTGRCVQYYDRNFKTCEIQAWCPVEEYGAVREPPLLEAINFTVLIENSIFFPMFKVTRINTKAASKKRERRRYLNRCHYDKEKEPYCPIFRLGYIADQARENFTELCRTGGVIGVFINWQCDFDVDAANCKPTYSFRLLDTRKDLPTAGYYYRFAKYYSKDGVESRTLIKAYGIRLDIIVHGHCSIICDWIMLTFIDKNEVYSEKKFDD
ncbi:hypothetical protein CRUP_007408, partial [Coryphaenoides rupestris]